MHTYKPKHVNTLFYNTKLSGEQHSKLLRYTVGLLLLFYLVMIKHVVVYNRKVKTKSKKPTNRN